MRSWDFERWVLFVIGTVVLANVGFMLWYDRKAQDLRQRLPTAEEQLAEIGVMAEEIHALNTEKSADAFLNAGKKFYEFVNTQETRASLRKGTFDIQSADTQRFEADGYVDTNYPLTPSRSAATAFSRVDIANFLILVEAGTARMKVTNLRLTQTKKDGKLTDLWRPEVRITDRAPFVAGL